MTQLTAGMPAPHFEGTDQDGNAVKLSSFIGNLSGLNGVFQLTSVNGIGNIVNSHLTLNVALVNLTGTTTIPSMQSLFGN